MLPYTIIEKKQSGAPLTADELTFFINGYMSGEIQDYQMSALLMSIFFRGMDENEVSTLIQLIIDSGERVRFADSGMVYGDKHSTGGVGDKISLILAPLLAATGKIRVPMVSGRGLGHSGGTLDKLESIPGFNTQLSLDQFRRQTDKIGCALIGQTDNLCPADKRLYALRDVTAVVRSIPLICASILSKKTAEGIQALILDVKTGNGAFMQTESDSRELAEKLVTFGKAFGLNVEARITDMNQPLGRTVGNWLEVEESLQVLRGGGPKDVRDLSLQLSADLLRMADPSRSEQEIMDELIHTLDSGAALEKFAEIGAAQGADTDYITGKKHPGEAAHILEIRAESSGYLSQVDNYMLGLESIVLGAGRRQITDTIDPLAGMTVSARIGDRINTGDLLLTLHSEKKDALDQVASRISNCFIISPEAADAPPLLHDHIR